jgi:methionyl-tRNA formyltransferase
VSGVAAEVSIVGRASPESGVRTVFFGSGGFAVPILDALIGMVGIDVVGVVSAPDRPVGRKAVLTPTPVTARARELGLPVLQPVRVRRPEVVAEIEGLAPQLIVLADYGQLIPRSLLDLPPRGFLNLHPSALPRWRGAAPIPATILAGDTESAVTLMVLVEEMDAGPIVATEVLEVRDDDTAVTLEERAAEVAARLLQRSIPEWLAGRIAARPQAEEGVTLTRPLRKSDGFLNPALSAVELERQVRAYQPWPRSQLVLQFTPLFVWSAAVAPSEPGDTPGTLVGTSDGGLVLTTVDGRLVLKVVQKAGGRPMPAADLVRGHRGLLHGWSITGPGPSMR